MKSIFDPEALKDNSWPYWKHALGIILALSFLVSFSSFRGGFVYDSATFLDSANLSEIHLSDAFVPKVRTDDYFRPMPMMYNVAIYRTLDLISPEGKWGRESLSLALHINNYVLHTFNTLLLFGLVYMLFSSTPWGRVGALFAAGWFGLHPIHAECVAWDAGHTDLIVAMFWLLATWFGSNYYSNGRVQHAAVSALMFLCALLTKENAAIHLAVLPAFLWALDEVAPNALPKKEKQNRVLILAGVSLLALVVYVALRAKFYNFSAPYNPPREAPTFMRVLGVYSLYLAKTVIPWPQSPYITQIPSALYTLSTVLFGGLAIGGGFYAKNYAKRVHVMGALWTFLAILPGLVYVLRPAGTVVATERIIYVPTIGVAFLAAALMVKLLEIKPARIPVAAVAGILLVAYAGGSFAQSKIYSSELNFWEACTKNWGGDRDKYVLVALGKEYEKAGRPEDAKKVFERALEPESRGTWADEVRFRFDIQAAHGVGRTSVALAMDQLRAGQNQQALDIVNSGIRAMAQYRPYLTNFRSPQFFYVHGSADYVKGQAMLALYGQADQTLYSSANQLLQTAQGMGLRTPELTAMIEDCQRKLAAR